MDICIDFLTFSWWVNAWKYDVSDFLSLGNIVMSKHHISWVFLNSQSLWKSVVLVQWWYLWYTHGWTLSAQYPCARERLQVRTFARAEACYFRTTYTGGGYVFFLTLVQLSQSARFAQLHGRPLEHVSITFRWKDDLRHDHLCKTMSLGSLQATCWQYLW